MAGLAVKLLPNKVKFAFAEAVWSVVAVLSAAVAAEKLYNNINGNTALPAKMRQWVSDNADTLKKTLEKDEDREPTPATNPDLFEQTTISKKKVFKKIADKSIWEADSLHGDHFEVYSSSDHFEKGNRNRAVWIDGRAKPL